MSSSSSHEFNHHSHYDITKYYILKKKCQAKIRTGLNSSKKLSLFSKKDVDVNAGSLWEEKPPSITNSTTGKQHQHRLGSQKRGKSSSSSSSSSPGRKIELLSVDVEDQELTCQATDVDPISRRQYKLLISINSQEDRYALWRDSARIEGALKIERNSHVYICRRGIPDNTVGLVRYVGNLEGKSGTWFGVELKNNQHLGETDGRHFNKILFECDKKVAIFCTFQNLRLFNQNKPAVTVTTSGSSGSSQPSHRLLLNNRPPVNGHRTASATTSTSSVMSDNTNSSVTGDTGDVSVGDRVIWISDTGPQGGYVRWLGRLDEIPDKPMAGVEFDNPVGTGSGKYNGKQLFVAPLGHASIVPLMGLLPASAFDTSSGDVEFNTNKPPSYAAYKMDERLRRDIEEGREIDQQRISEEDLRHIHRPVKVKPMSSELGIGDLVEVVNYATSSGVIRWIGYVPQSKHIDKLVAGIEVEEPLDCGTDGVFTQYRLFTTSPHKALFVYLHKCKKDSRFTDGDRHVDFGGQESPPVYGNVLPASSAEELSQACGPKRGIQGHHNSCYLDASLFCMFAFNTTFDSLLYREAREGDVSLYNEIQKTLKINIVNPLRSNHYVRADQVLLLRKLLDKLQLMDGLIGEEQDPVDFLNLLFNQVMRADKFVKFSNGSNVHTHQLLVEKDDRVAFPTVQQLLERSCFQNGVRFAETPAVLILQLPRFGKQKLYNKIFPSPTIDITHLLEEGVQECHLCGGLATMECVDCMKERSQSYGDATYCMNCLQRAHQHRKRKEHQFTELQLPAYLQKDGLDPIPRESLELFAVLCIETSHYVAFVKCDHETWIFFDSMADRKGAINGYNIPAVSRLEHMTDWLTEESYNRIATASPKTGPAASHLDRLLGDGYICFYRSLDAMMYK